MKEFKISRHRTVGECAFVKAEDKDEALDIAQESANDLEWEAFWNNPEIDEWEYDIIHQ